MVLLDDVVRAEIVTTLYLKLGELRQQSLVQMRDSLARGFNIAKDLLEIEEKLTTVGDPPAQLPYILPQEILSHYLLFFEHLIDVFLSRIFTSLRVNQFLKS